jgi:hypothetical protein
VVGALDGARVFEIFPKSIFHSIGFFSVEANGVEHGPGFDGLVVGGVFWFTLDRRSMEIWISYKYRAGGAVKSDGGVSAGALSGNKFVVLVFDVDGFLIKRQDDVIWGV